MGILHTIYSFISCWIFRLFLPLGYYEKCCYEHSCTSFCVVVCFHFSWVGAYKLDGWVIYAVTLCLSFEELPNFSKMTTRLHSHRPCTRIPVSPYPPRPGIVLLMALVLFKSELTNGVLCLYRIYFSYEKINDYKKSKMPKQAHFWYKLTFLNQYIKSFLNSPFFKFPPLNSTLAFTSVSRSHFFYRLIILSVFQSKCRLSLIIEKGQTTGP